MEYITCTTGGLRYKRNSNDSNHSLKIKHLAASKEYYCEEHGKMLNNFEKKSLSECEEHKSRKGTSFCKAYKNIQTITTNLPTSYQLHKLKKSCMVINHFTGKIFHLMIQIFTK